MTETKKLQIAQRLRLARENAGLSQGQIAKMMGLHRPSVSEMEAGRRNVSSEEISRLAGIYKVDVSWLTCTEEEEPNPHKDRISLAARELAKLSEEDFERLQQLIKALRPGKEKING